MMATDKLEDTGVDGKIILKWILKKYGLRMETGCIWLRTGSCDKTLRTVINLWLP
jgi:hypothetical protein